MRIRGWVCSRLISTCGCLLATTATATPFVPSGSDPIGSFPVRVTAGDLDGDGLADVVTSNSISGDLSVLLNLGGGLASENRIDPGGEPRQVAIADIDSDGDRDLVVALRGGSGLISVLTNAGNGTFGSAVAYGTAGFGFSLRLADVEPDGDLDVLAISGFVDTTLLTVFTNDGNGVFTVDGVYPAAASDVVYVADLDVADVNGDGLPDVVTSLDISHAVTVLINGGGGQFLPAAAVDLGQGSPTVVLLRDVNRDGAADLLVMDTCLGSDELRIGLNDGSGQFTLSHVEPLTSACHSFTNPNGLSAGYFDDDTMIDLAYSSMVTDSVHLLLNRGDGTFAPGDIVATDLKPIVIGVADIDGNGSDDIVSANLTELTTPGSVTTLLNEQCAPLFTQRVLADSDGFSWATTLPYVGVRGEFSTAAYISEFAVELADATRRVLEKAF